ncbi:glycosyltransferase [Oceanicola sp. 502str15]|uniref:glycosyltransferase n=1 Tax=Oceanicola sp. 502str15 TaxID=2696061 RepID=UPI0020962348|nr:glycosyltransferase [Oceanicola sp. 502str15]MCO6384616.1 glycosyltransferase [Oceanicola sp. 502str15]
MQPILFVNTINNTPFDAGAEKVIQVLRDELHARGVPTKSISVAIPGTEVNHGPVDHRMKNPNVYFPYPPREHSVFGKSAFHALDNFNPVSAVRFRRLLKEVKPSVIFTHNLRCISCSAWAPLWQGESVVHVHYLHDYQLLCTASSMFNGRSDCGTQCLKCRVFSLIKKRLSSNVDVVYGASEFILERHCSNGLFRRAVAKVMEPPLVASGGARAAKSDLGDIRRFGFLGRLVDDKGVLELVEAFKEFLGFLRIEQRRLAKLLIAGSGDQSYVELLEKSITGYDEIEYVGVVKPEAYFPRIDALIVPSKWSDPNPVVVIEAYQRHKPVIAAKVGGLITSVSHGRTGLHFEHREGNASLVRALKEAWSSPSFSTDDMDLYLQGRSVSSAVDMLLEDISRAEKTKSSNGPAP